jgi:hypothetical protein
VNQTLARGHNREYLLTKDRSKLLATTRGTPMFSDLSTFTKVHVVISLIAILAGFVVAFGLLTAKRFNGWTALFLLMTLLTSVTGFFFPFHGFTPAIGVGIISLVVLAIGIFARYVRKLNAAWRWIYLVTAMLALYLNVFVLIVQLFQKVPALKALAPTQTEPPFLAAQLGALVILIVLTVLAAIRFRPLRVNS